jgi:hypothetical protein
MTSAKAINVDAFPIPVTVGTLGEASRDLNKQLLLDIEHAFNEVEVEERTGIGIDQTVSGLEEGYQSFQILQHALTQFSTQTVLRAGTRNSDIKAEFLWANRNTKSSAFHMPHSHQLDGYMWTGVYFPSSGMKEGVSLSDEQNLDEAPQLVSKTQPSPGDLTLLDPLQFVKTGTATKKTDRYPYWGNPLCVTPREGTVVLFPTYLPHLVTPTEQDDFLRLSIAFYVKVHNGDGGIDKDG